MGVLDLGKIYTGQSPIEVIRGTVSQCRLAEESGYRRYWLAEHHETFSAWAQPCIMAALLAQATEHIRIGTAGILLPLYPPIWVAETFALLCLLFADRIDCGLGGAFADPRLIGAYASGAGNNPCQFAEQFESKLGELIGFADRHNLNSPPSIEVAPRGSAAPPIWVMSVSARKREIASRMGCNLCYSLFHSRSQHEPAEIQRYYDNFIKTRSGSTATANVAVRVICYESQKEIDRMGKVASNLHPDTAFGTPSQCIEQIDRIAGKYKVSEAVIKIESTSIEHRLHSCEMLGEEFQRLGDTK